MFLGDVRVVRSHGVVLRGPGSVKTAQVRLRKDGLGLSSVVIGKVPAAPTMPCGAGSSIISLNDDLLKITITKMNCYLL